ncbi:MAG: ABC transporter ATP-binding protein/permease [Oscillospiraceae bacterium]|jgi:ABC-type multidrug transport system fused ATPase/permease subunit|nr:ABC transporter ATP-binding protein/permease [Oscillospiraceae bacterium]
MENVKRVKIMPNLSYMIKNWYRWDKKGIAVCLIRIPALIALPAITAFIPKIMIDYIQTQVEINRFVITVAFLSIVVALLSWIDPYLLEIAHSVGQNIRMRYRILAFDKILNMDYANLESYEGRLKFERGKEFAFGGRNSGSENFLYTLLDFFTAVLGVFAYIALLSQIDFILLLIIIMTCGIETCISQAINQLEHKHRDEEVGGWYKLAYLFQVATNPKSGKDIRMYNAKDWFIQLMLQITSRHQKMIQLLTKKTVHLSAFQALCSLVRELSAYGFLVAKVLSNGIDVANFVFYIGLVLGFSSWISGISNKIIVLQKIFESCEKFRAFLEIEDRVKSVDASSAPRIIENIEFKNIFFSYEQDGANVLKDVSFSVSAGEKIAIVGENGAGKTTMIKLLCGLYAPTLGEICINGVRMDSIDRESYFELFSVVFQDFNFLPASIGVNICITEHEDIDYLNLESVLEQSGLLNKIQSLPAGIESKLIRQMDCEAVELSGGEKQRLLLARALYKNAPILILDEPTAALDPIAEKHIYDTYNTLTKNKTAFFISHRLASTRFCDRILYMKDGHITEIGSHDDLLNAKGDYWRMFQTQCAYYHEEVDQ